MSVTPDIEVPKAPPGFLWRLVRSPSGAIGLIIVLILIFCALCADVRAPSDPNKMG